MPKTPTDCTLTFDQQLELLKSRGCNIEDEAFAHELLSRVSYYRLSEYFLPFKTASGDYKAGTSFAKVCKLYDFDKKLRVLIFDAIEEIEVFLRCQIAYYFSFKYGQLGYLDKDNFSNKHNHASFLQLVDRKIKQSKDIPFIKHHIENYGGRFPLWVLVEIFTFGMLSFFFSDLKTKDQKALSRKLFDTTYKNVANHIHCCSVLRNICAHYGKLYFRAFSRAPSGIQCEEESKRRLWAQILCVKSLYPNKQKWTACFAVGLKRLIGEYEGGVELSAVGFPQGWQDLI